MNNTALTETIPTAADIDFNFVLAAIRSCNNQWQLECCETLISLFVAKHGNEKEGALTHELIVKTTWVMIV